VGFDKLLADLLLGGARIGRGVGHDKPGAAFVVQRRVEELNPEIVGVVGARQAERITAVFADRVFEPVFIDSVYIEGRIRQNEIEATRAVVLAS